MNAKKYLFRCVYMGIYHRLIGFFLFSTNHISYSLRLLYTSFIFNYHNYHTKVVLVKIRAMKRFFSQ